MLALPVNIVIHPQAAPEQSVSSTSSSSSFTLPSLSLTPSLANAAEAAVAPKEAAGGDLKSLLSDYSTTLSKQEEEAKAAEEAAAAKKAAAAAPVAAAPNGVGKEVGWEGGREGGREGGKVVYLLVLLFRS